MNKFFIVIFFMYSLFLYSEEKKENKVTAIPDGVYKVNFNELPDRIKKNLDTMLYTGLFSVRIIVFGNDFIISNSKERLIVSKMEGSDIKGKVNIYHIFSKDYLFTVTIQHGVKRTRNQTKYYEKGVFRIMSLYI